MVAEAARIDQKQELVNTRSKTSCPCFQVACADGGRSDVAARIPGIRNMRNFNNRKK